MPLEHPYNILVGAVSAIALIAIAFVIFYIQYRPRCAQDRPFRPPHRGGGFAFWQRLRARMTAKVVDMEEKVLNPLPCVERARMLVAEVERKRETEMWAKVMEIRKKQAEEWDRMDEEEEGEGVFSEWESTRLYTRGGATETDAGGTVRFEMEGDLEWGDSRGRRVRGSDRIRKPGKAMARR